MSKKIGLMLIGMNGAIATTVTAGIEAIKKQQIDEIGLITQIDEFKKLNLVSIENLQIGGWDIVESPHIDCMRNHHIVDNELIDKISDDLAKITVYKAPKVGITKHILNVDGIKNTECKTGVKEAIAKIIDDINDFVSKNKLDGVVIGNLSSTEPLPKETEFLQSIEAFEEAIESNNSNIKSGMIYAYAAIKAHAPYFNFTPSVTVGNPALTQLALREHVAVAGNDGKTGQTLYKTVIAPMLKWRNLKLEGWYSTNILGNNDGRVLEEPDHKETKIRSKSKVLSNILGYDDFYHRVEINYYPPRNDAKEAWDNIDFKGWLGKRMSMKINWIGEDSILAAPLVVDIARLLWYTQEREDYGVAKHLSSFFKDPINNNDHNFNNQIQLLLDYIYN